MGFGVILGEDGKRMKTRAGDTVKLMTLIDEATQYAKTQILQRQQEEDNKYQID